MAHPPIIFPFYDFPLAVRQETRRIKSPDTTTFRLREVTILSVRNPDDKHIMYEHPPRVIPPLSECMACNPIRQDMLMIPSALPYMQEFFECYLGLNRKSKDVDVERGLFVLKHREDIPLAVLLTSFRAALLADIKKGGKHKRPSTAADEERAYNTLLEHEGCTFWKNVSPRECGWLNTLTEHHRRMCYLLMRKLFNILMIKDIVSNVNGWDSDPLNLVPKRLSPKSSIRKSVNPSMLTYEQIQRLIFDKKTLSSIEIAILLIIFCSLSLEEICGLNIDDFVHMRDYDRMAVLVTKRFAHDPAHKNGRTYPLTDPYERRIVPIPVLMQHCLESYCNSRSTKKGTPLLRSKDSSKRRMSPQALQKSIGNKLKAAFPHGRGDAPITLSMLANTCNRELKKIGLEEEEIRSLQGRHPLSDSTWAIHYNDFASESEMEKIGNLQDQVMTRVMPPTDTPPVTGVLKRKDQVLSWLAGRYPNCTCVDITIDLNNIKAENIPEAGITLELFARCGYCATVTYQHNNKEI